MPRSPLVCCALAVVVTIAATSPVISPRASAQPRDQAPPPPPPPPPQYDPFFGNGMRPRDAIRGAWSACNEDVLRFCAGILPGGGRILSCLAANRDRLSPACIDGIQRARAILGR